MSATRLKLILIFGGICAVFVTIWPSTAESPVGAAAPSKPPDVIVQHELIHPVQTVADVPRPRRPQAPIQRLASRKAVQAVRSDGIAARAGRVLLGDGRFRPEPFPRPGR